MPRAKYSNDSNRVSNEEVQVWAKKYLDATYGEIVPRTKNQKNTGYTYKNNMIQSIGVTEIRPIKYTCVHFQDILVITTQAYETKGAILLKLITNSEQWIPKFLCNNLSIKDKVIWIDSKFLELEEWKKRI